MGDIIKTGGLLPANNSNNESNFYSHYGQREEENSVHRLWDILRKRKWWLFGFVIPVISITALFTFLSTPIYRASTLIQIEEDNTARLIGDRDPLASMMLYESTNRFYETQYMLLNSSPIAYRLIESLNLKEHAEYKKLQKAYPDKSTQELEDLLAKQILANLEVKPLKRSFLVEVSFKSPDKNLAQEIANHLSKEYMKLTMATRQQSYVLIKEWLEGELGKLASKVEYSEKKLFEHGQQKDFLSLEGKENVINAKYIELGMLLTKAQAERAAKEGQHRQIKENGVDASAITNNLLVQKLREETITQEAKVASLNRIYGENYPQFQAEKAKLKDLSSRLNNEVRRAEASIKADYETAVRTENLLRDAMESQKHKVVDLQNNLVTHHILKRDLQANEQIYQGLLSRMKEASVASTIVASNVAVIAPAKLPQFPYLPKKLLNLTLGLFVGLMGGVGLAFLMEYLDNSIKSTQEMEAFCRLPVFGMIPFVNGNSKLITLGEDELGLMAYKQPKSPMAEAIYHIRTSIMLSSAGGAPAAIMITSPNPNEGKTTISLNIASALAMNNRKVVILDADLRKPSLHSILQEPMQPGLSNFLTGTASLAEIIRPTEIPNLFFISAGTTPPNPIELLSSDAFGNLLKKLRQDFRHLVLDTPPILGFTDGRAISALVDGAILIFKHNYTRRENGLLAMQLLAQVNAPILGGILNMARKDRLGYGERYGYYYYAKYYNEYYDTVKLPDRDN